MNVRLPLPILQEEEEETNLILGTTPQVFGNLVDNCFNACVDDFTSKALSGRESGCISRCVTKSMTTQTRLGERFAELNAAITADMQKRQ